MVWCTSWQIWSGLNRSTNYPTFEVTWVDFIHSATLTDGEIRIHCRFLPSTLPIITVDVAGLYLVHWYKLHQTGPDKLWHDSAQARLCGTGLCHGPDLPGADITVRCRPLPANRNGSAKYSNGSTAGLDRFAHFSKVKINEGVCTCAHMSSFSIDFVAFAVCVLSLIQAMCTCTRVCACLLTVYRFLFVVARPDESIWARAHAYICFVRIRPTSEYCDVCKMLPRNYTDSLIASSECDRQKSCRHIINECIIRVWCSLNAVMGLYCRYNSIRFRRLEVMLEFLICAFIPIALWCNAGNDGVQTLNSSAASYGHQHLR